MSVFIGIDLGTTNSAICSYDGKETRIWKSPEQNDVTPSAIYIDRRKNKYLGKRAYDSAPHSPDNSAILFKRLMGTSTPVNLSAVDITMTPEECSAEILKLLYGYLPEETRHGEELGVVITVPAAFNQMQKDATMQAANMAGIGKVALMQEPVAAVMSVMRSRDIDGMFLIYDLGGGTLDIAIAESIGGKVNLLAHGGIAMCGGRDFDRALVDNIVRPWLFNNFNLPENLSVNPEYKSLMRLASWATEKAKIELSSNEEAIIGLSESELRLRDLDGNDLYLDITLYRKDLDKLIDERLMESIEAARETISNAGLSPHDLERIVFVGGPTNYKPLRDKVSFELGVPGGTDVNPMTAVSEGASLFAESIDWDTKSRSRKSSRGHINSGGQLDISFNYIARTPDRKSKIGVQVKGTIAPGSEFQVDSFDTGWTSGKMSLKHGATVEVPLVNSGENLFKVFVFDPSGGPVSLEQDKVIITRTAATVGAIPASHSIAIEVLDRLGGRPVLEYLIKSGEALPKKERKVYRAAESLKSGSTSSLNFKLWEGEIEDPITDNRSIGVLKISGSDFDGVIPAGAKLECEYEILDSGNVVFTVSVPEIGAVFHSGATFYSRQEGQLDYSEVSVLVADESERTMNRIAEVEQSVTDPKLELAKKKLESAALLEQSESETENAQEAMEKVLEAKRLLAQVRKDNLPEIRQIDLDGVINFFNDFIKEHARPAEINTFESLCKTAKRTIENNGSDFEHHLDELKQKNFEILWRQDWFVMEKFKSMLNAPHLFSDKNKYEDLTQFGQQSVKTDDFNRLREVVVELSMMQRGGGSESDIFDVANIVRG